MGLKLKVCADCGIRKMIGRSKNRCKDCRRADPNKFLNRPPGSSARSSYERAVKDKKRLTIGPFVNWYVRYLPKCVNPSNGKLSMVNLSGKQRDYVLGKYGFANYATYLRSDLWASIRRKVLRNALCECGCGCLANQVHHKVYTEANLMGANLTGLVPINHSCHYNIEFSGKRKVSPGNANGELKRRQSKNTVKLKPPSMDEVNLFLSGKSKRLPTERKMVVREHLKQQQLNH